MNKASKTVYYFGFYLLLVGTTLIFAPNILLSIFGMDTTGEVWIMVVGVLVINIGLYYILTSPTNNETFNRTTVYTRALVVAWFALFVMLGWAKPALLFFGGVDLSGAAWTWISLKKQ
ncbi:MAG: hypothetical protein KIS77_14650 [Saprospiraceae bacterium]|nr:hypothetical protein [Saprospiraceae bacterium]